MKTARQTLGYQKSAGSISFPGAFAVLLMVENDFLNYHLVFHTAL